MQETIHLTRVHEKSGFNHSEAVGSSCNECGGTDRPILATVSCLDRVETYLACPHCMTKADDRHRKPETPRIEVNEPPTRSNVEDLCGHFLGYLGKRPRGFPVPDDCLTCEKMIKCLHSQL